MGRASDIVAPAAAQAALTIDLQALADNWKFLALKAGGAECAAVVKADAYGIGIEPAVRALLQAGCKTFFVAHASEGAQVRAALGARAGFRIYVLNGLLPGDDVSRQYIDHGLRPVVGSLSELQSWIERAILHHARIPCALHIDTGMNRLGLSPHDIDSVAARVLPTHIAVDEPWEPVLAPLAVGTFPAAGKVMAVRKRQPYTPAPTGQGGVYIDLVMSHFISSEEPDSPLNWRQISDFKKAREKFPGVAASICNSSGIFLPQKPFLDLVRPGYALYGGNPTPGAPNPMRAVISLQAPIIQLREIEAGQCVGYNGQWTAKRPTRLATIGVGYADGVPRALMATDTRPGGEAMVLGRRCPFAGRVSMDLIVIDVTDVADPALAPGTLAELLGESIGVDDMGARAGTIGYEVLTSLGRRYRRRYIGG